MGKWRYQVVKPAAYVLQGNYCMTNGAGAYYWSGWSNICILADDGSCSGQLMPGMDGENTYFNVNALGVAANNVKCGNALFWWL